MIIQSPESAMPEPYRTYIEQRSRAIGQVLQTVVYDDNVQLCPRAITSDEQLFSGDNSHIYGVVVRNIEDGYKSVLYGQGFQGIGLATTKLDEAITYTQGQMDKGNRVRVKDPCESDGKGQYIVESVDQLFSAFDTITKDNESGCVLMPHLDKILHRISIGRVTLGGVGKFTYFGREQAIMYNGAEVYGGTTLGLFHSGMFKNKTTVEEHFNISPELTKFGESVLDAYSQLAIFCGRVSIDVIEGVTDSGEVLCDAIDITPRVGGTTPAEVLAIREAYRDKSALCYASSQLMYNPTFSPATGLNFIDTDTLVINAQVHEVR